VQGTVRLHVVLSTDRKVQQLDIVSGDPVLANAAAEAVRQWEYKPTLLNGERVEVDTIVDVVFSLSVVARSVPFGDLSTSARLNALCVSALSSAFLTGNFSPRRDITVSGCPSRQSYIPSLSLNLVYYVAISYLSFGSRTRSTQMDNRMFQATASEQSARPRIHQMIHSFCALLFLVMFTIPAICRAQTAEQSKPTGANPIPEPAIPTILAAFDEYEVVGIDAARDEGCG
jgi:hypothetical protein